MKTATLAGACACLALAALAAAPVAANVPSKMGGRVSGVSEGGRALTMTHKKQEYRLAVTDKTLILIQNPSQPGLIEDGMSGFAHGERSADRGILFADSVYVLPPEQSLKPDDRGEVIRGQFRRRDGRLFLAVGDKETEVDTNSETKVIHRTVGSPADIKDGLQLSVQGIREIGGRNVPSAIYIYPLVNRLQKTPDRPMAKWDETFERYDDGASVLRGALDRYAIMPGGSPGQAVAAPSGAPDALGKRVLAHKGPAGASIMTRILDAALAPMTGEIVASVDFQWVSGTHSLYVWRTSSENKNGVRVILREDGRVSVSGGRSGAHDMGKNFRLESGKWYRMRLDLTPVVNADKKYGRVLLTLTDLDSGKVALGPASRGWVEAFPQIGGAQLLSHHDKGPVEAYFDNWTIESKK